jgi:exopolysaccharide biosynthesis polyprenyl glycosylphosphotransferase
MWGTGSRKDMTPQLAATLRIHDPEVIASPTAGEGVLAVEAPVRVLAPAHRAWRESEAQSLRSLWRREALHRRMLCVSDALATTVALFAVLNLLGDDRTALAALLSAPLVVVLFKIAGLYDRDELRLVHSTLDEAPLLLQLTGLFALCATILQPIVLDGTLGGAQIAGLWIGSFAAILGGRVLARWMASRVSPRERCLVIGDQKRAERVIERLRSSSARAVVVASLPLEDEGVDGLIDPENIRQAVSQLRVHRIILVPTTTDTTDVTELIRAAKAVGVRVSVLPRMFEAVGTAVEFDDVNGMMMLGVRRFGLVRSSRLLKRGFDVVAGSLALLLVAPLMAAIAIAIRLDSKGPVFFRQPRVGRDGRHFGIFKFRSMVTDADEQKDRLRVLNEAGTGLFKISHDPRVTRVGGILRRTSLDELPQLINVVLGEMSLVGPRPLVIDEDALVVGLDRSRLHLTPGMTGPWQVLGTRVPMQEMVGIDYLYVANWSLWLDMKILLRTVRHVVRQGNV